MNQGRRAPPSATPQPVADQSANRRLAMLKTIPVKNNFRGKRGNVIVLGMLCCAAVATTFLVAYGFFNVMFVHNLLQGFADKVTLAAACALNDSDRLGDMNNLVAQAR